MLFSAYVDHVSLLHISSFEVSQALLIFFNRFRCRWCSHDSKDLLKVTETSELVTPWEILIYWSNPKFGYQSPIYREFKQYCHSNKPVRWLSKTEVDQFTEWYKYRLIWDCMMCLHFRNFWSFAVSDTCMSRSPIKDKHNFAFQVQLWMTRRMMRQPWIRAWRKNLHPLIQDFWKHL